MDARLSITKPFKLYSEYNVSDGNFYVEGFIHCLIFNLLDITFQEYLSCQLFKIL